MTGKKDITREVTVETKRKPQLGQRGTVIAKIVVPSRPPERVSSRHAWAAAEACFA